MKLLISFPYDDDEIKSWVNIIFPFCGAIGAIIMFVADLILYYPTNNINSKYKYHRTSASYFESIDPGGTKLAESSMQFVSINRVMLGGVLGPISAIFYTIGFIGCLFVRLWLLQHAISLNMMILAIISSINLSLMMIIGSVYHALFVYTCFLSKEIAKISTTTTQNKKKNDDSNNDDNNNSNNDALHPLLKLHDNNNNSTNNDDAASLHSLLQLHQSYLKYIYKWAGTFGLIGSMAYIYISCFYSNTSSYPKYSILFIPAASAPIKKLLREYNVGGIIICGGLTNLWNLCFFTSLYYFK